MDEIAYREIENDLGRRWGIALIEGAAQLVLVLIYVSAILARVANGDFESFFQQFTNWSWIFQTLFYTLTLPVPFIQQGLIIEGSLLGRFTRTVVLLLFFPLVGVVFTVVIVISIIFADDESFLNGLLRHMPASRLVLGNDLLHVWPIVFVLLFYILYHRYIFYVLNYTLNRHNVLSSGFRTTVFIFYESYGAGFFLMIYSFIHDPHVVYRTEIPTLDGILVVLVALTVTVLISLMIILGLLRVGTSTLYGLRWLLRNEADPDISRHVYLADESLIKEV